jgi:hypothetical protein
MIGIAKLRGLRNSGQLKGWEWFFNWLLDKLVGFGYQPAKPIVSLLAIIVIGACVFSWARNEAALCPADFVTKTPEKLTIESCQEPPFYPNFEPVLYSIEVIVPAIDFHQKKYWELRSDTPWSGLFQLYSWVHGVLGWIFSLLAALSPTKLLRREAFCCEAEGRVGCGLPSLAGRRVPRYVRFWLRDNCPLTAQMRPQLMSAVPLLLEHERTYRCIVALCNRCRRDGIVWLAPLPFSINQAISKRTFTRRI